MGRPRRGPPEVDRERGLYEDRSVARVFTSPDGMTVLVGRSAEDNDRLTFALAAPGDFWLHAAAVSGSHVVVLNPEGLARLPRATRRFAAALAARHSRARRGGTVTVHLARRSDVSKPRAVKPGTVELRRYESVQARPAELDPGLPD